MPVNRAGPAEAPSLPTLLLPFVELVLCSVRGTTFIDVLSFESHKIPRWSSSEVVIKSVASDYMSSSSGYATY